MCDCFCLHSQTGGCDSVGSNVFVYSPSILLDREPPNQTGPMWLIYLSRSRCHVACCWLRQAFVLLHWLFQLGIHGSACLVFLVPEYCSRAWHKLNVYSSPLIAWALRGRSLEMHIDTKSRIDIIAIFLFCIDIFIRYIGICKSFH